ncbi:MULTISPECIES: hypothetical protein [Paenibacillus]|uniref:hypothetical protein n=1 Tax=Paenibacillus TaxID=44249 RepID=UPI0030CEDA22
MEKGSVKNLKSIVISDSEEVKIIKELFRQFPTMSQLMNVDEWELIHINGIVYDKSK